MKFIYIPLLLFFTPVAAQQTLFFNGKIFTGNRKQPFASAILVDGDRILAVGSLPAISKGISTTAKRVDLNGGTVLPGLIDSHIHAIDGGETLVKPNLADKTQSVQQLFSFIDSLEQSHQGFTGDVLDIYGLNISTWTSLPDLAAHFNANKYSNIPVFLRGSDGHTAWANMALLRKAGIDRRYIEQLPEHQAKYFSLLADKEPSGFVAEDAVGMIAGAAIPDQTNWPLAAQKAMQLLSSLGITAWLDPSAGNTRNDSSNFLNAYASLYRENGLNAHVVADIVADADGDPIDQINTLKRIATTYNHPDFMVKGFKIFADGVLEYPTQTAAISIPYKNTGKSGVLMFDPRKFARFITKADSAGLMVHVHAIGDRAVTETLNGFEEQRKVNGQKILPHSITHLQLVQPSDFKRFKKLNILTSQQLLWAFGDVTTVDIVKPYIDELLYKWQYPAKSMLDAGVTIAGASDWPVSSANPFEAIATAETRQGDLGVLNEKERLPRINMFYGYTIEAARVIWLDSVTGTLETGKFADMILVDRDPFSVSAKDLAGTKVVWTMFKGKLVHGKL